MFSGGTSTHVLLPNLERDDDMDNQTSRYSVCGLSFLRFLILSLYVINGVDSQLFAISQRQKMYSMYGQSRLAPDHLCTMYSTCSDGYLINNRAGSLASQSLCVVLELTKWIVDEFLGRRMIDSRYVPYMYGKYDSALVANFVVQMLERGANGFLQIVLCLFATRAQCEHGLTAEESIAAGV